MTSYRFDVFKLDATVTADVPSVGAILQAVADGNLPSSATVGGLTRDLWRQRHTAAPRAWFGQFRKFREGDLPLIGSPGEEGQELEIDEDQALIEKNYFLLVAPWNILVWQVNGHASTPSQFTRFLADIAGTQVAADPVLQPDAMRRLMRGDVQLKRVKLRIARPTEPGWFPADDFSRSMLDMLAAGGGDSLYLEASVDGRLAPTRQHELAGRWKRAIRTFVNQGLATSARVEVMEDGIEHPIDLIADRLQSYIEVDFPGRNPPAELMLTALRRAWADVEGQIAETFGNPENAIRG